MKISLFAVVLLVGTASAQKVYVMKVDSTTQLLFGKTKGTGRANVVEGGVPGQRDIETLPEGFSYTYVGCPALIESDGASYYPARWKGSDLVIAVKVGGTAEVKECLLHTELRPRSYYTVQGARVVSVARGGQ